MATSLALRELSLTSLQVMNDQIKIHIFRTFITRLLGHIHQKQEIALQIAAKIGRQCRDGFRGSIPIHAQKRAWTRISIICKDYLKIFICRIFTNSKLKITT
jgi:hypothetical protein